MPRLFGIDPLLVTGIAMGSSTWLTYQQQMGMQYQLWHNSIFNNPSSVGIDFSSDYNDSCDVGVTSDGDCSCGDGSDDGSDGGCGGGD